MNKATLCFAVFLSIILIPVTTFSDDDIGKKRSVPVKVVNTPGVKVKNTPGVTVENTPGVTVQNDSESPVPVSIVNGEQNGGGNGVQSSVEFLGFSDDTTDGTAEFGGMAEICQTTYGVGARICTTKEIVEVAALGGTIPSPNSIQAWVQPIIVATGGFTASAGLVDITGLQGLDSSLNQNSLNCDGWTSSVDRGAVVSNLLGINQTGCANVFQVSCCR